MNTLTVELAERSYPILIGPDLLDDAELMAAHVPRGALLLVSNTTVAPLYAAALKRGLKDRNIIEAILPDGESYKTLETLARILDVAVANRLARDSAVVALGGGVVGDMAGFAAACYQRGVDFVQVPTTLLAQVDSSVGGKTGVNHPGGKNLIGAFHQPVAVIADTNTLATLPPREVRAGLAEIIKYGLIHDAAFFDWLEVNVDRLLVGSADALTHAIRRSCEIKAEIVGKDEREHGDRALLNLGHTFGHAIEAASGYGTWLHGEAVGAGMLMAAAMSKECGYLGETDVTRLRALLHRVGLPLAAPDVSPEAALEHMKIDKKVKAGRMRFVLLKRIGSALVTADYPGEALQATLDGYFG
ncbi:MAG TPA: 3-dehydroquinate synthase [Steroidobacteraceae bacterium]|nr:3-dehydroquinate synthase [Steroidobacteraceae bacterium]